MWFLRVVLLLVGGAALVDRRFFVSCSSSSSSVDGCWQGITTRTCIINGKFYNINSYDVHILCTAEDDGRDSGDRFQKVYHAELNGCLTYINTNPFELLPRNMNNLKKLTLKEFYIGILAIDDSIAPYLPKLEELILQDNVIYSYSSDFFATESIKQLKVIQFAGLQTMTPSLEQLNPMTDLQSLVIRDGNILINYKLLEHFRDLNSLEIYSSNVTVTDPNSHVMNNNISLTSLILEDSHVINNTVSLIEVAIPFRMISNLKIRNTTSARGIFNQLDVSFLLNIHPQISSLVVQRQNLSVLTLDLHLLTATHLHTLDVTDNHLDDIDWKEEWDANLARQLIDTNHLRILIDRNPWGCQFFTNVEEELFEYEKNYNTINVRGLKCRHNSTKGSASNHLSNRPLDLNNMWLLYGCVLSSLLLIISVTYLICAMCRSKRREPFYRSLAKWRSPTRPTAAMSMRKLPPTNYETPLQYRTIEFKSEDNCEIYEEIPANATGQTLQVII